MQNQTGNARIMFLWTEYGNDAKIYIEEVWHLIEVFKKWILESERIVFFGGAGVSTESGIPDFRSVDGLYNQ